MFIVVAECSAVYAGRLDTTLPIGVRTIMVKSDGTILIHGDSKSKPLNWMPPPNVIEKVEFSERNRPLMSKAAWERHTKVGAEWRVVNTKTKERLTVVFHRVMYVSPTWDFGSSEGLMKDGTEDNMQRILAANPSLILPAVTAKANEGGVRGRVSLELIRREYPTPIGPVDILYEARTRRKQKPFAVAVEVKRRGHIDGVDQLCRYMEFVAEEGVWGDVTGVYAAQKITPQALVLIEKRGNITPLVLDYDELKRLEPESHRKIKLSNFQTDHHTLCLKHDPP